MPDTSCMGVTAMTDPTSAVPMGSPRLLNVGRHRQIFCSLSFLMFSQISTVGVAYFYNQKRKQQDGASSLRVSPWRVKQIGFPAAPGDSLVSPSTLTGD